MVIIVKHEPRKEVIIHEMSIYSSPEELANKMTIGIPQGALPPLLKWVDRVVMTFTTLNQTDFITKEIAEGKLHWDHVSIASMEEYRQTIVLPERAITVDVTDVSANETFQAIGKFLREEFLS